MPAGGVQHTKNTDDLEAMVTDTPEPGEQMFVVAAAGGLTLTMDQETQALNLPRPEMRLFLYAYARTGTLAGASRMLMNKNTGRPAVTVDMHNGWLRRHEEYKELFDAIDEGVASVWDEYIQKKAVEGVRTVTESPQGTTITHKDSERLLALVAGTKLQKYREVSTGGGGTTINITIERPEE